MKVVHVLRRDHAGHVGGDVTQLHATVAALRDCGVDASAAEPQALDGTADVVHLYNLQLPYELATAHRLARRRSGNAVIALSPIYWPLDRAAVRRERGTSPAARVVHAVGPRRRLEWLVGRRLLMRSALVLPNSQAELGRLARHFRVRADSDWCVVPNGIWVDQWTGQERDPPAGSLRIACVARLEPQKNQRKLVQAAASIPDAELHLVGPPGEAAYAAQVVADMGRRLGPRGHWHGALEQGAIRRLLADVHVHVLPSFRETPGLASMEAAAAGCAIVATREGAAEEYFGGLAHYADPRSAGSIAEAIGRAASAPQQPELARLMQRFEWSEVGRLLADAYERILARSPRQS